MTTQQRKAHLARVHSAQVVSNDSESVCGLSAATKSTSPSCLSLSVEDAAMRVSVPLKCLEGVWKKAHELLNTEGAIAPAPGQAPKAEARMVLSYSGKAPHMVLPRKGGDFSCDGSCPNWKALGICSHSVVVAEINKLTRLLSIWKKV